MRAVVAILVVMMCAGQVRAEEQTVEVIDPGAGRKKVALYLGIGGLALWASSIGVSLVTKHNYDKCASDGYLLQGDAAANCPYTDPQQAADYVNRQQRISQLVGTGLFVGAVGLIGTAVYLRVTAPAKRRVVRVSVTPDVSPGAVGLSLSGGF